MPATPTTIWGNVKADGTVLSGSGYRVEKIDTGLYTVIFNTSFNAMPGVSVTEIWPQDINSHGGNTKDNAVLVAVEPDRFRVKVGEKDGDASDRDFSFVAIGI